MVASEIVHYLMCKRGGSMGEVALKIDISKAYDRVSWEYLQFIMLQMGFDHRWVDWIIVCVSLVQYSIRVNDDEVGLMRHGRGLR